MLVGLELEKYKKSLSDQKKKINDYLETLNRENNKNFYDHLYLICDLFSEVVLYLDNLDEAIFLRNPFYDDLTTIIRLTGKLESLVSDFFNQDKLSREQFGQEEDHPTLIAMESYLSNFFNLLKGIKSESTISDKLNEFTEQKEKLNDQITLIETSLDDLKNIELHEIFADDSGKFKTIARLYEIAFYIILLLMSFYFFGWYIDIDTAKFKFKLAEQFHGNHTPIFYVQKISLLIISTTLAAFLLKCSFMNRRLADEAYRTAKELDALPRYMAGMPNEMKDKIRFDLAYKYFGNGIHHDSYTGGENLMHENIKANTEFLKSVKDLSSGNAEDKENKNGG